MDVILTYTRFKLCYSCQVKFYLQLKVPLLGNYLNSPKCLCCTMNLINLIVEVLQVWRGTQVWVWSLVNWSFSMLIKICVWGGGTKFWSPKNKQSFYLFYYDINVICQDLDKYVNGIV